MERPIGASTRLVGLVGWPVTHSHSPAMHEAAFAALGLDLRYLAFPVPPAALPAALAGAAALGLVGLNVTVPHKEAALSLCEPDETARRVGAVNTITFREGRAEGGNTDLAGFVALCDASGVPFGVPALVLGTGGASRAVVAGLVARGHAVTLVSRGARQVAIDGIRYQSVPWTELPAHLGSAGLLVDATPRGLDDAAPPLDLAPLDGRAVVLDLVVRAETPLVRAARARGLRAEAGGEMLLHQGAEAFTRFTGQLAPLAVMRAALEASLAAEKLLG